MPVVGVVAQDMLKPRGNPLEPVLLEPALPGDRIRSFKSDADFLAAEDIRILRHHFLRRESKFFPGLDCKRRRHSKFGEKKHNGTDSKKFFILIGNLFCFFCRNSPNFCQLFRVLFNDREGLVSKHLHQPFGDGRPNPLDRPGRKIACDCSRGCRHQPFINLCFQLQPVFGMVGIGAGDDQRLSHRDVGKLTNDSHQLLIGCQLEHSVPIFRIVKHDGLHTAFQSVKLPAFHLCTHPFVTR